MIRNIILQLLFVNCAYSVVTQDCLWKDGEAADGYVPCTTDSTARQGTCCHQGDVCLDSGLCYGSVGLVYRGACMSEWSSSGCLTYCDDITDKWANLWPCAFSNSGSFLGPEFWWCGNNSDAQCSGNGTALKINPGFGIRVLANSSTPSSSTSSSLPTGSTPASSGSSASSGPGVVDSPSQPPVNRGTTIGLAVGLGILVLGIVVGGVLWMRYHRQQKAKLASINTSIPLQHDYRKEMDGKGVPQQYPPVEMDSTRMAELDTRAYRESNGLLGRR